jgi:CPA2 family monovalent cation:H+ antiporter-2
MNIDTVNSLNKESIAAVYGDSTKKEILKAAGIDKASYLIVTVPLINIVSETAALSTVLNPKTRILVRSRFLSSEAHLKQIGVAGIAFEEEVIGKSLTALLLEDLHRQKMQKSASQEHKIETKGNIK